jgi:hypothetical protein
MARLIKAEDAAKWIRRISEQARPGELDWRGHQAWDNLAAAMKDCIGYCPTVDAVEVVHGRWEDVALRFNQTKEKCSVCGGIVYAHGYNYCPNCGAKMDGERRIDG